ncbi:MAG: LysR family transcriptional regulator ArgP [Rhizobiales bacterium]|nr:LysR family transcriptional regulator ArgP [Hyphomicrobiales bacterium]NRB15616.1 LysR family transcriptional regulator ArgP [Hyphomicrobiales bacterium]
MLNYELLVGLKAVIIEGSFEAAAKLLNITPSAISQRIKLLEERLETPLIIRGKPCEATEYGYALFKHAEQVEVLERNFFSGMPKTTAADAEGAFTLRMAVNADSMATWFPAAVAKIAGLGNFLFDMVIEDEGETAELLRKGDVIAGITSKKSPIQGFQASYLGSLRYVSVASPEYIEKYFPDGIINVITLGRAPSLTFNRKDKLPSKWSKLVCGRNVNTPTSWIPSLEGYMQACEDGIGWGMHPLNLVNEQVESGKLVELVPHSYIDTPLYWQHSVSYGKIMLDISELIVATSKKQLPQ